MIELRELLEADAFTPVEVAAHAVPGSRWITVDAAEDLIERLHPAPRSSVDSDSARRFGAASSRDEGGRTSESPDRSPAPPGPGSGVSVSSPSAVFTPPAGVGTSFAVAFWSKVDRSAGPTACWPWTGARTTKGYGRFYDTTIGGMRNAPRLALALDGRPVPSGRLACHHCDNPPCVNPAHLYVGTLSSNALDMYSRGRGYRHPPRSTCAAGHPMAGPNLLLKKASWGTSRRCRTCEYSKANARRRAQRRAAAAA